MAVTEKRGVLKVRSKVQVKYTWVSLVQGNDH